MEVLLGGDTLLCEALSGLTISPHIFFKKISDACRFRGSPFDVMTEPPLMRARTQTRKESLQ
jgi:hypothetical protein